MRLRWTTLLLLPALLWAADEKKKSAPKPAPPPAKQQQAAQPVNVLPKNARQISAGVWEATETDGTVSRYQSTPWGGIMKVQGSRTAPGLAGIRPDPADRISAVEDGDNIRFEKPGPLVPYTWTTRKSELNDEERAVWERVKAKQKAAAKQTATGGTGDGKQPATDAGAAKKE